MDMPNNQTLRSSGSREYTPAECKDLTVPALKFPLESGIPAYVS